MYTDRLSGMTRLCQIVILFLAALAAGCNPDNNGKTRASLLSLPYRQFDQTQSAGWRALADRQQFQQGAVLIQDYLPLHPELGPKEKAVLHFHAAQLLAVAGHESEALVHLEQTAIPDGSSGFPPVAARWNDFVAATRAFLLCARSELMAARARMAAGPSTPTDLAFLKGIDVLVSHYGESYRDVYLSASQPRK